LQIIFLGAHYSATNAHVVGRDFIMTSFAPILNGLGLKCQFVEDQEATERLKSRVPPRKSSFVRGAPSIVLTVRYFKRIGRKGAQARVDNSTKEQRQEWARKAAIARWRGP
jgi:hypothetical protein